MRTPTPTTEGIPISPSAWAEATIISEVPEDGSSSISRVLQYCQKRILRPYLKVLATVGLKRCNASGGDMCTISRCLNKLWVFLIIVFITSGYLLQFLMCYRRDYGFDYAPSVSVTAESHRKHQADEDGIRQVEKIENGTTTRTWNQEMKKMEDSDSNSFFLWGEWEKAKEEDGYRDICTGNPFFIYCIPCFLHALSFIYMFCLYWLNHDEQVQNLMERVFIQASHSSAPHTAQKRVMRTLKFLVFFGFTWWLCSISIAVIQIVLTDVHMKFWVKTVERSVLTYLLGFTIGCQDAVQVTVIISYCIHCHLLTSYLDFIQNRISQHSITLSDCIKEFGETEKLLKYINNELANGFFPLLIMDTLFTIGSLYALVVVDSRERPTETLTTCFTFIQWLSLVILPLFLGTKLSNSLKKARELGHMVRMRPFGYQNYETQILDSFLLFVSTMRMDVRIMKLPLTSTNISVICCLIVFGIIVWGYFNK